MNCEYCNEEHNGSYGSGRFCNNKCARGFSTKKNRKKINEKVSRTLSFDGLTKEERKKEKHSSYIRETELHSILDVSKRTSIKILKRMKLPCSNCNWYVPNVAGDLHHIVEKKNGGSDDNDNLSYICPNCHRLVHSGIIKSNELISLQDYIGDEWKQYYFVKGKQLINKY